MDRTVLLHSLSRDEDALLALAGGARDVFLWHIRLLYPSEPSDDDTLFRKAMAWILQPGGECPANVTRAAAAFQAHKKKMRTSKRHFILDSGLNTARAERDALLESTPIIRVEALNAPYPPYKEIIAESPDIYEKWCAHFAHGKQPDSRLPRLAIHQLDAAALAADIGPNQSARLETASGELAGLVIRNFCKNEQAVAWAGAAAGAQLPDRRNIRMEDTGKLVQLGWSAGQRSKQAFHWVHNITTPRLPADQVAELNRDAGCLFAFAWQRMRSVLPPEVVDDFNGFVSGHRLPRMDPDDQLSDLPPLEEEEDAPRGTYKVTIQGQSFEFHGVELAPPSGVVGENYSRATHYEAQPHDFAASWTILRTPSNADGCHFYFAKYGVRVHQAPNTLIVWRPQDAHGTSLPNVKPHDPNPLFCQRGLAFVTSNRLAGAWRKYQSGKATRDEALQLAHAGAADDLEEIYEE